MPVTFTAITKPHGWLGNFSKHALRYDGKTWPRPEHLFQALRLSSAPARAAILAEPNPMQAKWIARGWMRDHPEDVACQPCSAEDLANMNFVIALKLELHPELVTELLRTGADEIIEDCTARLKNYADLDGPTARRALFWGKALRGGEWVGQNHLGLCWMALRERLASATDPAAVLREVTARGPASAALAETQK